MQLHAAACMVCTAAITLQACACVPVLHHQAPVSHHLHRHAYMQPQKAARASTFCRIIISYHCGASYEQTMHVTAARQSISKVAPPALGQALVIGCTHVCTVYGVHMVCQYVGMNTVCIISPVDPLHKARNSAWYAMLCYVAAAPVYDEYMVWFVHACMATLMPARASASSAAGARMPLCSHTHAGAASIRSATWPSTSCRQARRMQAGARACRCAVACTCAYRYARHMPWPIGDGVLDGPGRWLK